MGETKTKDMEMAGTFSQMAMSKRVLILDEYNSEKVLYEGPFKDLKVQYKSEDIFYRKLRVLLDNKQVYFSNK